MDKTEYTDVAQLAADLAGDPALADRIREKVADSKVIGDLMRFRFHMGVKLEDLPPNIAQRVANLECGTDSDMSLEDIHFYTNAVINFAKKYEDSWVQTLKEGDKVLTVNDIDLADEGVVVRVSDMEIEVEVADQVSDKSCNVFRLPFSKITGAQLSTRPLTTLAPYFLRES